MENESDEVTEEVRKGGMEELRNGVTGEQVPLGLVLHLISIEKLHN